MHIFIDESGTFAASEKTHSVSAVGALVVPSAKLAYFEKLYRNLRPRLPMHNGEVKGRLLTESDVRLVVDLLLRVEAFFEVVAVDLGLHTQDGLDRHKKSQEEAITQHLTEKHHPNLVADVWKLRHSLEQMSTQLYVQAVVQSELVYDVLNHSQIYFAFRKWRELGSFHWTIDAKGEGSEVPWERWWKQAMLPMVESKSIRKPFPSVREGNYRAMQRFVTEPSEFKRQLADPSDREDRWFDLKLVMTESMTFSDEPTPGLETVDILVNSIRRSLAGNFTKPGWLPIREVMIHRSTPALRMIALADRDLEPSARSYASVVRDFSRCGISMFP